MLRKILFLFFYENVYMVSACSNIAFFNTNVFGLNNAGRNLNGRTEVGYYLLSFVI